MTPMRWWATVALASGMMLGGCGGDSGGGDTDTDAGSSVGTATTPTSTPPSDPPDTFPDTFDDDDTPEPDPDPDPDPTVPMSASDTASETTDGPHDTTSTGSAGSETDTTPETDTHAPTSGDPPPDGGACCDGSRGAPGCDDEAITACVCAQDPFCCEDAWDEICVVSVVIHGCGVCEGVGGEGDCCADNGTPGCDDDTIEACVCEADSVCCLEAWDETCAQGVEFEGCGRC